MKSHLTSTPRINSKKHSSLPVTPNHSRLTSNLHSPKYLIASPPCGTSLNRPSDRGLSPVMNSSVNVSLYTNTQSPGLASRIVQYDKAQNGKSPIHKRKFVSPGIFPIVHLYKQKLPEVTPKPKKVTVRIAPPEDLSWYNHVDHAIIMSENSRITTFPENTVNERGTRSVLDALKEISRKRIHSAAEFETSPEGCNRKRNKNILETSSPINVSTNSRNNIPQFKNDAGSNKRIREESPPGMNCAPQSATNIENSINGSEKSNNSKRYCSIDPITASFTSANLRYQELRKCGLTKTFDEYQEDLPGSPLRKIQHVNVDTQTNLTEITIPSLPEVSATQSNNVSSLPQVKISSNSEIPVISARATEIVRERPLFDPKPLEVIRRNKLAALLGAISGQNPVLERVPLPDVLGNRQVDVNTTPLKPITSTLSNNVSSFPIVVDNVTKKSKHVTFDLPSPNSISTIISNPNITHTTTSLVLPISSTMIAPSASISSGNSIVSTNVIPPSITTTSLPQISPPKIVGGFKFDLQQSTPQNAMQTISNAASLTTSNGNFSTSTTNLPSITCNSAESLTPSNILPTSAVANLSEDITASTTLISEVPSFGFNFGTPKMPQQTFVTQPVSLEGTKPLSLCFGTPNPNSTSTCTQTLTNTSSIANPSFNFDTTNNTTTNSAISGKILFGAVSTNSIASTTTNSTVAKPTFSFQTKPTVPSIEPPKPELITTSAITLPLFSSTPLTTHMFAKPSGISSPFQVSCEVTSNNVVAVTSPIVTTTANNTIGFPLTTTASTNFNQLGTPSNLFGGTTSTNATGASANFSFGGSSTSNIPVTTTNSSNTGLSFNSAISVSNTTPKSTFGASNNAPVVTTEISNNLFGVSPFASSIAATNSGTSSNSFGTFGTKFGETAVTTQAVSSPASNLFSFGGSASTEQPKLFGSTGTNNSGTSALTFGTSGAPKLTFGSFGTSNNTFGNNQTEIAPNQTVQANNSTFNFGSTNAFDTAGTFNNPNLANNTFGGGQQNAIFPTPTFANPQQPSKLFTFGTATTIPKAIEPAIDKPVGVFSFGTPVAKPQATPGGFNFSAGSTTSFGATSSPTSFRANPNPTPVMFGSAQPTPAFNVGGGFNAPGLTGGPGMFSIGSGSSTGPSRPRTQLKPKRRT